MLEAAIAEAIENQANPSRRLELRGAGLEFQTLTDPEIILAGPRETGKTMVILYRLHQLAQRHPLQAAIIRKYHVDLHGTVLSTFEKKILKPSDNVKVYGGSKAEWYDYPRTGARIYAGGMDRPGSTLSAERDIVFVNQVEQLTLDEWETITSSTTGRAGNVPFAATWGDCNPDKSQHWILMRAKERKLKLLNSFHKDNPALYDAQGNETEQGRKTIARLDALTGVRRKRLYEGLWVTPEGTVYDEFDSAIHVQRRDPKEFQYWVLTLDEGYNHPAVILLLGIDNDLRVHIAQEFYQTGVLPSAHAREAVQWARRFGTRLVIVDASAAGLIAEIANLGGMQVEHSKGHVAQGIGLVHELLKVRGDKRPGLTIDPDCVNTANEFESYVYRKGTEEPVKENDHALDALRNFVFWTWGEGIEEREIIYPVQRIGASW